MTLWPVPPGAVRSAGGTCALCGEVFGRPIERVRHERARHFRCDPCQAVFATERTLLAHKIEANHRRDRKRVELAEKHRRTTRGLMERIPQGELYE